MKVWRYSRWDGSQQAFSLDADAALDALSELMMESLSAEEALAWMQRAGFELAGLDMRVMGVEELLDELRSEVQSLEQRYRMDEATADLRRRLAEILDREQRAMHRAENHWHLWSEEPIGPPVEREPGVRAVVYVSMHVPAAPHDETAQRPIAAAHREAFRARVG